MHGKASERRKNLHCDDGIMALLIQRMVDGRFWSTCYSTSIYLTGHGIRETCVYGHCSITTSYITLHSAYARVMSKFLALLVTPLCSYYFDSSFLFYTLLRKANRSKQQNNKGEAASTSSISSGAGQGNGGLFLERRILLSFYSHFFMREESST